MIGIGVNARRNPPSVARGPRVAVGISRRFVRYDATAVSSGNQVTSLLRAWRAGDEGALEQLVPLVYAELRRLADREMRRERVGHTFRPTDLVSEAYLRLSEGTAPELNDRAHFFAVAVRYMRQVLVDHARHHAAEKRGARAHRVTLDESIAVAVDQAEELIALDDALRALAEQDPRKAQVVELHYLGGMTQEEIALVLDVHVNTVARDLRFAAAWLGRALADP